MIERRYLKNTKSNVELRAGSEDDERAPEIRGHAAVVNVEEEIFPGFREVIQPGAFEEAIERDDVRALWNHDSNIVLGRNVSGTLSLREDEIGLAYAVEPPDTQLVRDMVLSPIKRGDVTGSSFGFRVDRSTETPLDGGGILRSIEALELVDVSPVTFPAYPDATVALRGVLATKNETECGTLLRAILDRELTDEDLRGLLVAEGIVKPGQSKAPASTDDDGWTIQLRRLGLDLARLEAEG